MHLQIAYMNKIVGISTELNASIVMDGTAHKEFEMSMKFFTELYQNPVNSEVHADTSEVPMLFRPKVPEPPQPRIAKKVDLPNSVAKKADEMKIVIPAGRPPLRKPPNSVRVNGDAYSRPKQDVDDERWLS